jgi:hypothetical protein
MKRVKGVEDLNIRIVRAQGIVDVGVTTRICIFLEPDSKSPRGLVVSGDPADEQESHRQHEPGL